MTPKILMVVAASDLDECIGRIDMTPEYTKVTFYYVLTENWPFIPRKFRGTPDASFRHGPPGGGGRPGGPPGGRPGGPPPLFGIPFFGPLGPPPDGPPPDGVRPAPRREGEKPVIP